MLKPKQTKASSSNTCVHEITSEKELRDIVDNHAETNVLFHWDKCPGCQEMRSELENGCNTHKLHYGKTPVAILGCEVGNNPDCARMWDELRKAKNIPEKEYGVPVNILIPQKGTFTNPDHMLISAAPEKKVELNNILQQLGAFAANAMSNASPNAGNQPAPPQTQQAPPPVNYPAKLYHGIANYVNDRPSRVYQMSANPTYQPLKENLFCLTGYDCDQQTFQQKITAYINSPSPSSMLWR